MEYFDLNAFIKTVHQTAKEHGWWDKPKSPETVCALIHSEWSEALEEYRRGKPEYYMGEKGKPEGMFVELIDGVIRILDWFGKNELHFGKNWCRGIVNDMVEDVRFSIPKRFDFPMLICELHSLTAEHSTRGYAMACVFALRWIYEHDGDPYAIMCEKDSYNATRPYRHGNKVC